MAFACRLGSSLVIAFTLFMAVGVGSEAQALNLLERQHENERISLGVKVDTLLKIQSDDFVDDAHPYPNPDGRLHHHCPTPCPFIYRADFFKLPSASPSAVILAGTPHILDPFDPDPFRFPYLDYRYDLSFYVEDNASFDFSSPWSINGVVRTQAGGLVGYTGSLSVLGSGFSFGVTLMPGVNPPFAASYTGDFTLPQFSFNYADNANFAGGFFEVHGFVKDKDPMSLGFGRVFQSVTYTKADSDFSRDQTNLYVRDIGDVEVYDVVHAPQPGSLILLATGLAIFFVARSTRN